MIRSFCILMAFASSVQAETYVSDAFGIVPETAIDGERANWAGLRTGGASQSVQPLGPNTLFIFIGAKSMVAGKDDGHAVALTLDQYGNLLREGSVEFSLETNGKNTGDVRDGIADLVFQPAPKAGVFAGGASIGSLQSARALYRVTTDLESVSPQLSEADPLRVETFETLTTTPLADQFGNLVEDGIGMALLLDHDDGSTTLLSAPVREAKAEATILVRDITSGGTAKAYLGTNSGSQTVDYAPMSAATLAEIQIWTVAEINSIGVRVGPITTDAGHLLNDGAPIEITVDGGAGKSVTLSGWLQDGLYEAIVPGLSGLTSYAVTYSTALGKETRTIRATTTTGVE